MREGVIPNEDEQRKQYRNRGEDDDMLRSIHHFAGIVYVAVGWMFLYEAYQGTGGDLYVFLGVMFVLVGLVRIGVMVYLRTRRIRENRMATDEDREVGKE